MRMPRKNYLAKSLLFLAVGAVQLVPPLSGVAALFAQGAEHGRPPSCRPAQLVADYLGGEGSTQQLFGWFVVRDTSPAPCSFPAQFAFAGLDARGHVVTTVLHPRLSPGGLVLTPRARLAREGAELPRGEVEAALTIVGPECWLLDPTGKEHLRLVKPARWFFLLVSGPVLAPNALPPGYSSPSPLATGFESCKGAIASLPLTAEQ